MKALLLNGSPNARGCTYTALSEVEKTLNQNGVETEILQLGKGAIRGCIGCGACRGKGRCAFGAEDGVNRALEKLETAGALIIGSPVYYASPNGALIAFLDRLFFAGPDVAGKVGAAVVSARRAGTTAALDVLNKYFLISGMPIAPSQYWNMVHGNTPAEVAQDLEGLQIMRRLGENVAYMMKCFEAGRVAGVALPPAEPARMRTNFIR